MTRTLDQIKREREDLSTFLVHLTRDTKDSKTAKENLGSILGNKKIEARGAKGLCHNWPDMSEFVHTVCFTETPLTYLRYLFDIEGRNIKLEPYGLVFCKDFLQQKGANPVFYINTDGHEILKKSICHILNNFKGNEEHEDVKNIAPYIDIFGKDKDGNTYDFYWEREWRYLGDFTFNFKDIVVALCEEECFDEFEQMYPEVNFISPRMSMEQMILKIAHK